MKATSESLTLVAGAGRTGKACAHFLQKRGMPFALVEPDCSKVPAMQDMVQCEQLNPVAMLDQSAVLESWMEQADALVLSPGISPHHPLVLLARRMGVELLSDLDFFMSATEAPVAAITGTNGKSTVTVLLGEMAQAVGMKVGVGGNLGPPATDLLCDSNDCYVLEVSSFQLEYCRPLRAEVAVMLNLHFDHLDRHGNLRRYADAKRQVFSGAKHLVYNRQDCLTQPPVWETGKRRTFGLGLPGPGAYGIRNGVLCRGDEDLMPIADLGWQAPGSMENALAALAAGDALGMEPAAMCEVLRRFRGLPHRFQTVKESGEVRWVNDSKATNPAAAAAAIRSASGDGSRKSVVLIAGGEAKDCDMTSLVETVAEFVQSVVLIGRAAPGLAGLLKDRCRVHLCVSLEAAMQQAAVLAVSGDTVLLAPGCATDSDFVDYRQRGDTFARLVQELGA